MGAWATSRHCYVEAEPLNDGEEEHFLAVQPTETQELKWKLC